ncbi:toxin WapA [Coriobacteriaceae bacterium EMTCatB1]|nr:toxin WapA [Coriobacteriaceae bacterium EMTCatB1]
MSATPVAFFIATTARGDVAELLDSSGAPFALYSYDAYGNPGAVLSAATARISAPLAEAIARANALRYAGYAYDAHSGLYYLSKRYYDPATAQFLTKDPAKADGEESAYQYCAGDPVGKVDPSGERAKRLSRTHWFTVVRCDVSVWMLSSGTSEFVANEKRSILLPEPKRIGVAELAAHWEFRDGVLRVYGYLRSSTERSSAVMITGRLMRLMRDGRGRRYTAPVPCVRSDSYVSGQKNEAELISFSLRYERSWVSGLTARMKGAGRYSDGVQWPGTVRLELSNPFGDRRPVRVAASGSAGSRLATDVRYTRLMW